MKIRPRPSRSSRHSALRASTATAVVVAASFLCYGAASVLHYSILSTTPHKHSAVPNTKSALHPLVEAELRRAYADRPEAHVNVTRIFGTADDRSTAPAVTVIRRDERRSEPRPLSLQHFSSVAHGTAKARRIGSKDANCRSSPDCFSAPTQAPLSVDGGTPASVSHLFLPGQGSQPAGGELLSDGRQPAGLPEDFDWQTYLEYHPELAANVSSAAEAAQHYRVHGAGQGLLCRRLRVALRFTAYGGLTNQIYGLISVLMLAAATGAEVYLPPAFYRSSFAVDSSKDKWTAQPPEDILDVEHLIQFWQQRGIILHKTPPLVEHPDRSQLDTTYAQSALDPRLIVTFPSKDGYQRRDLDDMADALRATAVGHAEHLLRQWRGSVAADISHVMVDLPHWVFEVNYTSASRLAWDSIHSLQFAPRLAGIAAAMHGRLGGRSGSRKHFNAVHLRIEADMEIFVNPQGGEKAMLDMYIGAMRALNFSSASDCFVASGLSSYNATGAELIRSQLLAEGVCKSIVQKEQLLTDSDTSGLSTAQLAAVDMLMATRSTRFVGFTASSFSKYVMYTRLHLGHPLQTNELIGRSWISDAYSVL